MTGFEPSYISPVLNEIENELVASKNLHLLLDGCLGDKVDDQQDEARVRADVPILDGWYADILDAADDQPLKNRYGEPGEGAIEIVCWLDDEGRIGESYHVDGPKLRLIVYKNGVFNQTDQLWLSGKEIEGLKQDLENSLRETKP